MNEYNPHIASIAVSIPPFSLTQKDALEFINKHYSGRISSNFMDLTAKVFSHPSVTKRHFAIDNLEQLVDENADERIERFCRWAVKLSEDAAGRAMAKAGVLPHEVSGIVVNTCTGYLCPGISTYLIERLGLNKNIAAYDLVGSGCAGAVPNLGMCGALLKESDKAVVISISVEICSAAFQVGDDAGLVVSNALFADGASASVLWNRPGILKMVSSQSTYAPEHREEIRFVYKNGQLHNKLSARVPVLAARAAREVVNNLLKSNGLLVNDIEHWAIHPGGDQVIAAVKKELGLSDKQLEPCRKVLSEFGNMSSATAPFVLKKIIENGIMPGSRCILLSYGAGLSAHAYLLEHSSPL